MWHTFRHCCTNTWVGRQRLSALDYTQIRSTIEVGPKPANPKLITLKTPVREKERKQILLMNSIRGDGKNKAQAAAVPPFISPFLINFENFLVSFFGVACLFYLFEIYSGAKLLWEQLGRNQIMKIISLSLQAHFQLVKLKVLAEDKSWPKLGRT